jgi:hypothetical protein
MLLIVCHMRYIYIYIYIYILKLDNQMDLLICVNSKSNRLSTIIETKGGTGWESGALLNTLSPFKKYILFYHSHFSRATCVIKRPVEKRKYFEIIFVVFFVLV